MTNWERIIAVGVGLMIAASTGCGSPPEVELPVTIAPTTTDPGPTPVPTLSITLPQTLFVCLGREPESLYRFSSSYLYGQTGRESDAVLEAIYDGPIDVVDYAYAPVILQKLPSLADGDARLVEVEVGEGEVYLNPEIMLPDNLAVGEPYRPVGCRDPNCLRTYAGGAVSMERMEVDFQLLEGITWSDGQSLTAADSVYAFELDRHRDTPTPKTLVDRTFSYSALDERSVRWTGIPGYLDSEYMANFWSPLPQHVLGSYAPGEILAAPEANTIPIGWGPYRIQEWVPGQYVELVRNERYFRAEQGLPAFDRLVYRFLEGESSPSIDQLVIQECDILDESALADALDVQALDPEALARLIQLESDGVVEVAWTAGVEMLRLDFNLAYYPPGATQPLFGDLSLRQAIAGCLDRPGMLERVLFGFGSIPATFLPPEHPLVDLDTPPAEFDPADSIAALDALGWRDVDGDPATPREASGVPGIPAGSPLRFTYLTSPGGFRESTALQIQADLARCGAEVLIEYLPVEQLFQEWPDGPVFGGGFQAVGWAWPGWVSPLCEMFTLSEIPSTDRPFGINATAFRDLSYAEACSQQLLGLPGEAGYAQAVRQAQSLFAQQLPSIPIYQLPRVIAQRPDVCGIDLDPTAFSAFWTIESLWMGEDCPGGE